MVDIECILKYDCCDKTSEELIKQVKSIIPELGQYNVKSIKFENLDIKKIVFFDYTMGNRTEVILEFEFGKITSINFNSTTNWWRK